jgi:hypothetical protein
MDPRFGMILERSRGDGIIPWVVCVGGRNCSVYGWGIWRGEAKQRALRKSQQLPINTPYAATSDHTYVFDRETREVVWDTGHGGAVVPAGGFLYIVENTGDVYAFRAQEP